MLHSKLFYQIKDRELFKLEGKDPSHNGEVYDTHSKLNRYLQIDAINYEEIKISNPVTSKEFFQIVNNSFDKKAIKDKCYIHFINLHIINTPKFKEQSFINNRIIEIEKGTYKLFYTMQGLFFYEQNKEINLFLYEKLSQRWFSIKEQKWIIDLELPTDLSSITLVYFKRKQPVVSLDFHGNISALEPLKEENERTYYLKKFQKIVNMNPNLIRKDLDFYFKWLPLSDQTSFDYFKQTLMSNEQLKDTKKTKHLLLNSLCKIQKEKIPIKVEEKFLIDNPKEVMKELRDYLDEKTNKLVRYSKKTGEVIK